MKIFAIAGLCALSLSPVHARDTVCVAGICEPFFRLHSVSETKAYGLLLAAPAEGCRRVRYRVEGADAQPLGQTPPLSPGEIAVVRIGKGFAEGEHTLTIAVDGCRVLPAKARRVTLAKTSPDHGWRATN
jgi:hypothetical protein